MEYTIQPEPLEVFKNSLSDTKKWQGFNAKSWASYFLNPDQISDKIDRTFDRDDLFKLYKNKSITDEEICFAILSWGGMNREHGRLLFTKKGNWLPLIHQIREGRINSRLEAYKSFAEIRKSKNLPGMGPAYFTKLICFLNPNYNGYIMDQWTSKSINILTGEKLIHLGKTGHVLNSNNTKNYEAYCQVVERLAEEVNKTPTDTEEALFSYGGHEKGKWREYVISTWLSENGKSTRNKSKLNHIKLIHVDLYPIKFEDALNALSEKEIKMPTLGGRSAIHVVRDSDKIKIINSKGKTGFIDHDHWKKVMDRMKVLPLEERDMTSRYGLGNHLYSWKEVPNKVYSIYIPAIVKHLSQKN